jgi:predicted amidohydrolase
MVAVHILQVAYTDDESVADRVARVAALVSAQRGADLVVLPELWPHGGFAHRSWAERAEPLDGTTMSALAAAAREVSAVVHAGSMVERLPDGAATSERGPQDRGLWNTSVVFGPDGGRLAVYRKIHRFGFGEGEPVLLEAGADIVTVPLPLAGGTATRPFHLLTCVSRRCTVGCSTRARRCS